MYFSYLLTVVHVSFFYSIGSAEERREALLWKHAAEIVDSVKRTPRRQMTVYNFALNRAPNREEMRRQLQRIFRDQNQPFKVNLPMGFILANRVDHELRYHYASNNYMLLERPHLIRSVADTEPLLEELVLVDPVAEARQRRPDSQWLVDSLTNVRWKATKVRSAGMLVPGNPAATPSGETLVKK